MQRRLRSGPARRVRHAMPALGLSVDDWDMLARGTMPVPVVPRQVEVIVDTTEEGVSRFAFLVWAIAWGGVHRSLRPQGWEPAMDAVDRLFPGLDSQESTAVLAAANSLARMWSVYWGVPSMETHWFCRRCRRGRPLDDFEDKWTHTCSRKHTGR